MTVEKAPANRRCAATLGAHESPVGNKMPTLRIIAVTTFFPNSAEPHRTVYVRNLVHALRALCSVTMVAPIRYAPPLRSVPGWYVLRSVPVSEVVEGIPVLHPRFPVLPGLHWLSGVGYFFGIIRLLRKLTREQRPSLIHAHCAYPDGVGVALAARLLGLPYAITAHGSDINVYSEQTMLRRQMRWALCGASGVVAVSAGLCDKIEQLTGGLARVRMIPCAGFDPKLFRPNAAKASRSVLGIPTAGRLVVYVGQLVPIKGVTHLIAAWLELLRNSLVEEGDRLVIIGAGRERAALERQAAQAGACVQFVGEIPQIEVSTWLAAANLLCLASLNEGTPNVVIEALASGVPVVATRVGGVPDLIEEGVNGMLVPKADPSALAKAIATALAHGWDKETIQRSVAQMTWEALALRNVQFLESITSARTPTVGHAL